MIRVEGLRFTYPGNREETLHACLVALLVPNAMGIVLGFQLVEEKDEGSLLAVAVTPMSLEQYFLYRTTVSGVARWRGDRPYLARSVPPTSTPTVT